MSASNQSFRIFTDTELIGDNDLGVAYDKTDLKSANELLTRMVPQQRQFYQTGIINLARYRNLCLTWPSLSNSSTLSPSRKSNVVKSVPVTPGYGDIVCCSVLAFHDSIDVPRLLIKPSEFKQMRLVW